MRLENKVAIITGGSRGIGFATAERFIAEGAAVAVCASKQENADRAVGQLKEIHPDAKLIGICPNLADMESVKESFAKVIDEFGRIDILVNNAGISESTPFANYTEELYDKVMDLNMKGVFNATHVVVENM